MQPTQLPALHCHANCPHCGLPSEFTVFESGPGGDFATYIGTKTGSLYRVSLGKVHYQGIPIQSVLAPAVSREGSPDALRQLPENVLCKICGNTFAAQSMPVVSEAVVSAYEL